ncbi:hypothetical protein EEL33_08495 [Muribaculaceae bacterium Isolate-037 (Harlan)]|nr:hypothetical protein EEL33_08495 [Muribaculaceae bacterium Isolate-037 (Harlan)]
MIGNECMLGQIASFMEALGLTYDEVVHKIPFRNLLVMQRDKIHPLTGVKVNKTTGKEMAERRRRNKRNSKE